MTAHAFEGGSVLEVWEQAETTRVTLPDGKTVHGMPHLTAEYLELALAHGYGAFRDPRWWLCKEHEATHLFLAELRGLPESPTLRDVAEGRAREHIGDAAVPGYQWQEEREVLALQRFWNTGDHNQDPGGVLSALSFEFDLHQARETFLARFRNEGQRRTA